MREHVPVAFELDPALEALLDFLKRARGLDLTGYKRTTLERRFRRRMDALGCPGYRDYLDHLEAHPEEYEQLFDILLVDVTEFFRDRPAWQNLRDDVLPPLLAAKAPDEPIRVWSAGCASGQEAYTAAMVLAEELGEDAFRDRVRIYATDVDEEALTVARQALYTRKQVESVPEDLRRRYFRAADDRLTVREDLRRTVIVGRNDLVADAPISRLDLLICRNTLMYFTAETQGRILRGFHFALREHGVLMLGRSETMVSHRDAFTAIDPKQRIFRKRDRSPAHQSRPAGPADEGTREHPTTQDGRSIRDAALEVGPHAQVIVSRAGIVTFANLPARRLFGVGIDDLGRPLAELEPARTWAGLVPALAEAMRERRTVALGELRFTPREGEERRLDVTVLPFPVDGGASLVFEDVTRYASLRSELEGSRRDLELAYEEVQSTIDELETTNEELQSANEELQTTNEELQSTNEELGTMNEELQSTNDFAEAILASAGVGVAVVDRQQRVQVWNHRAEDLWGLRQDEAVDHHLLSLDIGLPVERLAAPLRSVLGGASDREHATLEAVDHRGLAIDCATTILPVVSPDAGDGQAVRGAIVLMENGRTGEED